MIEPAGHYICSRFLHKVHISECFESLVVRRATLANCIRSSLVKFIVVVQLLFSLTFLDSVRGRQLSPRVGIVRDSVVVLGTTSEVVHT